QSRWDAPLGLTAVPAARAPGSGLVRVQRAARDRFGGRCSDTRPGIWGNPLGNAAAVRCLSPNGKGPHLRAFCDAGGGTRTPDTRIMMLLLKRGRTRTMASRFTTAARCAT